MQYIMQELKGKINKMKMNWYKLVFKQNQPIHIGSGSWGVINQTYIFIPGWTIWGALTKAYNIHNKKPLSENQQLFETITCFYPSFNENGDNPLFPDYKNGVFHLGDYPEHQFRYEFTDTFLSTAIRPESRSAKDESLHEIEILLPQSKIENKQLHWVGLLGIKEDQIQNIDNFLKETKIYIGGDTRYGLGELELVKKEDGKSYLETWEINGEINENKPLKNFLEFSNDINFEGELILLGEFDFLKNKPELKEAKYFITTGSSIKKNSKTSYILKKGKFD